MKPIEKKFPKIPEKNRLPKEDLLAEPTGSAEAQADQDPRFKIPDEILLRLLARKNQETEAKQVVTETKSEVDVPVEAAPEEPIQIQNTPEPAPVLQEAPLMDNPDAQKELEDLKEELKNVSEKAERDTARWKTYEQNIINWKDQVMEIIENLKIEAIDIEILKKEIESLKALNRKKDEEIRLLMEELARIPKKGK